ncbi:MAG: hypothetical protein ACK4PR_01005 [Gammaproteobacteria bacterium]
MKNGSQWPSQLEDITQYKNFGNNTVLPAYLPANALCSPFPSSSKSTNCGYFAEYQIPTSSVPQGYFTYTIQTPSTAAAQKLLNAVPNSWISGTTLNIGVALPVATATPNNHGWIVSAGVISTTNYPGTSNLSYYKHYNGCPPEGPCSVGLGYNNFNVPGSLIYLPNCPGGYEGHVFFSPFNYETSYSPQDFNIHLANMTNPINPQTPGQEPIVTPTPAVAPAPYPIGKSAIPTQQYDRHHQQTYSVISTDYPTYSDTPNTQHLAYYITFCLPIAPNAQQNSTYNFSTDHWATSGIYSSWLQDGQCSTSWMQYLQQQGVTNPSCNQITSSGLNTTLAVGSADAY